MSNVIEGKLQSFTVCQLLVYKPIGFFLFSYEYMYSWFVNVLDGVLLIVAHMLHPNKPKLYKKLYRREYIFSVWILEVYTVFLSLLMYLSCLD